MLGGVKSKEQEDAIAGTFGRYLSSGLYELPDPKLPVKYPRTPGYRPTQEDNPCNAWYWCCDIKGASKGKLQGKTVAIKDNTCVAGVPMMNGSLTLEGFVRMLTLLWCPGYWTLVDT
ncbi:hypothetical protein OS493_040558 [Desmophyllum pertusum]|uniref:Uncharacterized protein n=1 Tax=Desmophyllum pertusum TaxID=174260 RepID=A0A9W9YGV8_9CNID|nr:hypothetical protein OS493_040558 [Desmophyllum pertusum]